jgi:hypothetical protein
MERRVKEERKTEESIRKINGRNIRKRTKLNEEGKKQRNDVKMQQN